MIILSLKYTAKWSKPTYFALGVNFASKTVISRHLWVHGSKSAKSKAIQLALSKGKILIKCIKDYMDQKGLHYSNSRAYLLSGDLFGMKKFIWDGENEDYWGTFNQKP